MNEKDSAGVVVAKNHDPVALNRPKGEQFSWRDYFLPQASKMKPPCARGPCSPTQPGLSEKAIMNVYIYRPRHEQEPLVWEERIMKKLKSKDITKVNGCFISYTHL